MRVTPTHGGSIRIRKLALEAAGLAIGDYVAIRPLDVGTFVGVRVRRRGEPPLK